METKKQYERPMITDNVKLEAIAGTCTNAATFCKTSSGTCSTLIAS